MAKAIIRHGHTVDERGYIHYDETGIDWLEADAKARFRLDRRKNWAFVDGELCESVHWSQGCSGCCGGFESRGMGCSECGYQGIVRSGAWVLYSGKHDD